jgi:hypothetical protein
LLLPVGVAARIVHHGVGEFVKIENLTAGGLSGLIEFVLLAITGLSSTVPVFPAIDG